MQKEIKIKKCPVSSIRNYGETFYAVSELEPSLGKAFIKIVKIEPHGLEEKLTAPEGFRGYWQDSLRKLDKFIEEYFEFIPSTYLRFDGWHERYKYKNRKLPKITKEGIERFMNLCEIKNAKVVIFTLGSMYDGTYYCSDTKLKTLSLHPLQNINPNQA